MGAMRLTLCRTKEGNHPLPPTPLHHTLPSADTGGEAVALIFQCHRSLSRGVREVHEPNHANPGKAGTVFVKYCELCDRPSPLGHAPKKNPVRGQGKCLRRKHAV